MLIISNPGRGWRSLQLGETLKTTDQYLDVRVDEWKVSSYWTSSQTVNLGKVPYRRAVSRGAKAWAIWAAAPKVLKSLFS